MRIAAVALGMAAAVVSTSAQTPAMPMYRVDNFAPSTATGRAVTVHLNHGDLTAQNISLRMLLADAFAIQPDAIFGLDSAALERHFDFRIAIELPEHMERGAETDARHRVLQAVIADRLKLVAHTKVEDLPVLAIQVAEGGIKFHFVTEHPDSSGINIANNRLNLDADSMSHLAHDLDDQVGRIVVDRTGLKGNYELDLTLPGSNGRSGAHQDWAALSKNMEQQAGLTLVETTAPIQTLVVEHAELAAW
jgi:uncharacterized protein (TIGR03435 family)